MSKFNIGNVIKTANGHIEIVTSESGDYYNTISFDHENSSSGHRLKTYMRDEMCWDCDINDGGEADPDCKTCKGSGSYKKKIFGMDKATLLAPTVKEYIMKRLTKNFEF